MGILTDWITEWLRGLLIDGIMGNLEGLFTNPNNRVGEIAVEVGTSPATWNAGVFSLIRQLSETVVLPIAGIVLTFVMCYELIQMLIDRNNLHDIDTWLFFKWIIKTFIAVTILSNTFNIVMAVFDVAQSVVAQSAGLVQGTTDISPNLVANMQATIEQMELGPLLGLWLQSFVVHHTMTALNIFIFVVVYGRMIEIYMLTSLAPLPFATVVNRDLGHMGHNYFRSLLAIGFQGLLIIVCLAIYAVLIQSIAAAGGTDIFETIWTAIGCTVLLCFTLLKTGSLAKAVFGAH
ncbi:MAG: VirB6/TrbL-like conjugal transfer protein, CD1112 family [Faecalibacterium prausnitzii]